MPEIKRPRRGSLAFYPRKRAKRIYPAVTTYPKTGKPKVLAFAGYKVGCTHVALIDKRKGSPTFGKEIIVPVTILECPPLKTVGLRAYHTSTKGLKVLSEAWTKNLPKGLSRKIKLVKHDTEKQLSNLSEKLSELVDVRLIVMTTPKSAGIGKKTPELFEIGIGGKEIKEKFEFAKSLLGKEINVSDFVKAGELVDTIAITKGKGTAGPVKRFGVKIQTRHAAQKRRHVGSLGQERPGKVRITLAMAGQLGFQRRTELNKRILKIGKGKEITPKGGFTRYGIVKSDYVLVEGSVPGTKKRLVVLRTAIRPTRRKLIVPEVKLVR